MTSTREDARAQRELAELARSLSVADRVEFLGFLPYEDLPRYYSLADVLLQTGTAAGSGATTMSLPVKEALACGTAVVRSEATDEDVEDGVSGYLVNPLDVEATGARISMLLSRPRACARHGRGGPAQDRRAVRLGPRDRHRARGGARLSRAFVTGVSGFAGRNLARLLVERGDTVAGTVQTRSSGVDGVAEHAVDIQDVKVLDELLGVFRPDVVYHLVAIVDTVTTPDVMRLYATNTIGTVAVLEAMREAALDARACCTRARRSSTAAPAPDELPVRRNRIRCGR